MFKQGESSMERSVAYRLTDLVGRQVEQQAIREAIREGVKVVCLEGEGGIGKTFLLTQAQDFIQESAYSMPVTVLGIVDFYDTMMHGSIALEDVIAQRAKEKNPDEEIFVEFFKVLDLYRSGRGDEKRVHNIFVEEFNRWVAGRKAVLCFDTAEALEYGRDAQEVIDDCKAGGPDTSAVMWIRKYLPQLDETTLLLAGRPTRYLQDYLKEEYTSEQWRTLRLNTLSLEESREYFHRSEYGQHEDKETIERVWLLTNGRPILLSLAIDWLHQRMQLEELYKYDLDALREEQKKQSHVWEQYCTDFETALIHKIRFLSSPTDLALYYAARARKGFTAEMLYEILTDNTLPQKHLDLTLADVRELVRELSQLSFVKHPYGAREGWYFLHDEMYDLVDQYIWLNDYPEYTHQAQTSQFIAEKIYGREMTQGLVADSVKKVREANFNVDLLRARRKLDILRTERLFYELEADPQEGYRQYCRLDAQAIDQNLSEWDDMLRVEFLRFVHTFPYWAKRNGLVKQIVRPSKKPIVIDTVNQLARALWVHRFVSQGKREKAVRIAQKLLDKYPNWPDFWKAIVKVAQGAAYVRLGNREARKILQDALDKLETVQTEDNWLVQHYRGLTYLYLGLQARAEWRLDEADQMYAKAHLIFEDNGEDISAARALNNAAFILIKQGDYQRAIQNVTDAIQIRDDFGDVVGKGLSLNTHAIALDRSGQSVRAWSLALDALRHLQLAKENGFPGLDRAIAMVYINMGRIQRHRARGERPHTTNRIERNWERAQQHLENADELSKELEPYYQFDLYNQLGLLYSNWANWAYTRQPEDRERYYELLEKSDKNFREADQLAKDEGLDIDRADSLEDWAWNFHLRRAYGDDMYESMSHEELRDAVFGKLKDAEELALRSIDNPDAKGLQAYYILGSVYHQRGRFIHKFEGDVTAALRQYALSVAYYTKFSVNPTDPLERRERVREHIRYTLEDMLVESSKESLERVRDEMLSAVQEENLSTDALRHWLDELIIDLTWE
jgi:hypothetical protein